jgi:2-polyprenyl-3-methyl-5-hydroxy-6-metoxy-1,4-benzoquinol methylase
MTCPICDGADYWPTPYLLDPKIERWRREEGDEAAYEWRLCRRCANAYPSHQPRLRVLQKIWSEHKSTPGLTDAELDDAWARRRIGVRAIAARAFRLFAPLGRTSGRRFLDIACGFGETVKTFADHGWDAEGIDADSSIAHVHHHMGIRVQHGQIEEMDVGAGYDLIHIAHAIYFITNPMRFLGEVHKRLVEGGSFCVVLSDFFAHHDPSLPTYAHTFFPTATSMRYALALAGFDTVLCKSVSGSIYIVARPEAAIRTPFVSPAWTHFLLRTKAQRYAVIGRPYLALRRGAKILLGRG